MAQCDHNERGWKWTGVPAGSGILAIRSRKTRKSYYIGVSDFRQRAYDHHRLLDLGRHHNVELQKDWDADGADNFEFVVVETVRSSRMLPIFKQVWLERDCNTYNHKNSVPT